jgi:hypothetical protein
MGKISKRDVDVLVADMAEKLGETEPTALSQLRRIVELAGTEFSNKILVETLELEQQGGLSTLDGKRKRTIGGTFFFLVKEKIDKDLKDLVFPNQSDLPELKGADVQTRKSLQRLIDQAERLRENIRLLKESNGANVGLSEQLLKSTEREIEKIKSRYI